MKLPEKPTAESIKVLRLPQVCEMTGLGKTMIYRLEAADEFPKRIKIGLRAVGWLEVEVKSWIVNRAACRSPPPHDVPASAKPP